MMDEGWTLSDLEGELRARGMSLTDVSSADLAAVMGCSTVDEAAWKLEGIN